jgi:hypothetical protein
MEVVQPGGEPHLELDDPPQVLNCTLGLSNIRVQDAPPDWLPHPGWVQRSVSSIGGPPPGPGPFVGPVSVFGHAGGVQYTQAARWYDDRMRANIIAATLATLLYVFIAFLIVE